MRYHENLFLAGVITEQQYQQSLNEADTNVKCDICRKHAGDKYVDGATKMGPWANMCIPCWKKHGHGKLGSGVGQMYDNETGEKIESKNEEVEKYDSECSRCGKPATRKYHGTNKNTGDTMWSIKCSDPNCERKHANNKKSLRKRLSAFLPQMSHITTENVKKNNRR